jgi:hypothetical protein
MHPSPRRRLVAAAVALAGLAGAGGIPCAAERPSYRGRPLVEVLRLLQDQGLKVVYSSAVVDEGTLVAVEPRSRDPRAALEEILKDLGLEARDGPAGSVVIVGPAAGEAGTLRGRVHSAARGAPVAGAEVKVTAAGDGAGEAAGATTRADGTFEIRRIPAGAYEVLVEADGFRSRTVRSVRVGPRRAAALDVPLQALPTYLEEVVVTPSRLSVVSQEQNPDLAVADEDLVLAPTFGGDVSRLVELLPGVAAPDNSAAFSIRGSRAGDVAVILDGLELYEPYHLLGFQSPFSVLDTSLVERVDVLGGAFTADLGDRHGGVVRMDTWAPGDPHRTRIAAGSLNSSVSHGGPVPGRSASWLVSARAWYPEAIRDSIELGESGIDPRFGDAYLALRLTPSARTALSAHALLAYDRLDFVEEDGGETVDASSDSGHYWLRLLGSRPGGTILETVLSAGRLDRERRGFSEPEDLLLTVSDERSVSFIGLRHDATWRAGGSRLLKAGFEGRRLEADYDYESGPAEDPASRTTFDLAPSGTSLGAYAAYRAGWSSRAAVEAGLRWDRQAYTKETEVSPRLNALVRLGERTEARVGVGRFYQSQRIHELRIEDGETTFRPAELSRQASLTVQHRLRSGLLVRLDGYYRLLTGLRPRHENLFDPIELYPETESDRVLVDAPRARLRGAELLLRTPPEARLYGWLGYAWSSAEDVVRGEGVPRSWDQPHAVRFLAGWRAPGRWSVALGGAAHTGWPTTPLRPTIATLPGGVTRFNSVVGRRNAGRFPWYARLDLKASRAFAVGGGSLRLDLEVINLTNRRNVCCVDDFRFNRRADRTAEVRREDDFWLGATPTFTVVWEF